MPLASLVGDLVSRKIGLTFIFIGLDKLLDVCVYECLYIIGNIIIYFEDWEVNVLPHV